MHLIITTNSFIFIAASFTVQYINLTFFWMAVWNDERVKGLGCWGRVRYFKKNKSMIVNYHMYTTIRLEFIILMMISIYNNIYGARSIPRTAVCYYPFPKDYNGRRIWTWQIIVWVKNDKVEKKTSNKITNMNIHLLTHVVIGVYVWGIHITNWQ